MFVACVSLLMIIMLTCSCHGIRTLPYCVPAPTCAVLMTMAAAPLGTMIATTTTTLYSVIMAMATLTWHNSYDCNYNTHTV